jgi:hypothetical protein
MLPGLTTRRPACRSSYWKWMCPQTTVSSRTSANASCQRSSGEIGETTSSSERGVPWQ